VSGQPHNPAALSQGKEPLVLTGWPQSCSESFGEQKFHATAGI